MKILVISELKNVNGKFKPAIWRQYDVNRYYKSAKEASKYHSLKNCEYQYEGEDGKVTAYYNNAKLDAYGTRYN